MGTTQPLILDLVEWVAAEPRPYAEVMERWRTSCPRLTVWEDSLDAGYVQRVRLPGREPDVVATELGRETLRLHGRVSAAR